MVTRGTKELVEGGPKEGCERGTSVGGNVLGDARIWRPMQRGRRQRMRRTSHRPWGQLPASG